MLPSNTNFESTKVTLETERNALPEDSPFNILLVGDWKGSSDTANQSNSLLLKPIEIDRDNFEEIFRKIKPEIELNFPGNAETLKLSFNEFDDLHPDQIFQQHPFFSELRTIRQNLKNQNTFEVAAREVRSWFSQEENSADKAKIDNQVVESPEQSKDLFEQILNKSIDQKTDCSGQVTERTALNSFIKNIVKPHLVQIDANEQSKLLLIVDEIVSDLMRKILHHPQFQNLESAWRGIYFLVKRIETGSDLKIYLYNISKDSLLSDLKNNDDLTKSVFYKVIINEIGMDSTANSWSVIGGNYTFSLDVNDVAGLIRIAKIAENANCPFISRILPEMFGFNSFDNPDELYSLTIAEDCNQAKLWTALRSSPESAYIGLTVLQFLSRLPYGAETDPTENFYFEEFTQTIQHRDYLWSNSLFIWIALMAKTYNKFGIDNLTGNFIQEIDGIPVHFYKANNEIKAKSCVEINMTQNIFEKFSEQGLLTMASFKNSDRIKLGELQSIFNTSSLLKGRWS